MFLYRVGQKLLAIYKEKNDKKDDKYFRYRIVSGYLGLFSLSLMPFIVALGDYQYLEQPIVNSGYLIMTIIYIIDFIHTSRLENHILYDLKKESEESKTISLSNDVIKVILSQLNNYESEQVFLEQHISIHKLSKKFNTNIYPSL